jgi:hypothetical protein
MSKRPSSFCPPQLAQSSSIMVGIAAGSSGSLGEGGVFVVSIGHEYVPQVIRREVAAPGKRNLSNELRLIIIAHRLAEVGALVKIHQIGVGVAGMRFIDLEALPRQKLTTPHTTTASHAIAAYVSPIVVSSITEAIILSYLYRDRLLLLTAKLMLRCSACHNLYMLRSFRQHACI